MPRLNLFAAARAAVVFALSGAATTFAVGGGAAAPDDLATPVLHGDGALRLDTSLNGAAVLSGHNLGAGDEVDGDVALTASGTSRAEVTLALTDLVEELGPGGGRLSEHLRLRVLEQSALAPPHVLYDGSLRNLGVRPLGTYEAGETRRYHFTALLPDASDVGTVQGARATATFRWTAVEVPGGTPARRPPRLRVWLTLPDRQRVHLHHGTLIGWVRCSQPCRVAVRGRAVDVTPRRRGSRARLRATALRAAPVSAGKNRRGVRFVLHLPRAARLALRRRQTTLRTTITVTATDRGGRRATAVGRTTVRR